MIKVMVAAIFSSLILQPLAAQVGEPRLLLDFSSLVGDVEIEGMKENSRTLTEADKISLHAGSCFPHNRYRSLAPANWRVYFLPSMEIAPADWVRETTMGAGDDENWSIDKDLAAVPVMEVYIDFSRAPAGTRSALILPPFVIPVYHDQTALNSGDLRLVESEKGKKDKFDSFGVLKRTGTVKWIELMASFQWPSADCRLSLLLEDENGDSRDWECEYPVLAGWWRSFWFLNQYYISEVKRRAAGGTPLRPRFLRFRSFLIKPGDRLPESPLILRFRFIKVTCDPE